MKLYAISGLGADKRVFKYLSLNCDLIPIDWIAPFKKESLEKYSERLAQVINTNEPFGILGVSFGGLVAVEISKQLNPCLTILISSAETNSGLRKVYQMVGKTKITKIIPSLFFDPPRKLAQWLFGAKNKELLNQILDDTDLKFAKWAINQLVTWKNTQSLTKPILMIGGTNDKLIPPNKSSNVHLIEKGEHFMIVDRAPKISQIINKELVKLLDFGR